MVPVEGKTVSVVAKQQHDGLCYLNIQYWTIIGVAIGVEKPRTPLCGPSLKKKAHRPEGPVGFLDDLLWFPARLAIETACLP